VASGEVNEGDRDTFVSIDELRRVDLVEGWWSCCNVVGGFPFHRLRTEAILERIHSFLH